MTEHLDTFLEWLGETRGEGTVKSYRYKILAWLAWSAGRPVTDALLREYGRHIKTRGLRPRTRRVIQAALRVWFDWLVEQKLMKKAPGSHALDVGRLDPPQQALASQAQIARMWAAADSLPRHNLRARFYRARTLAVLALACNAGLRRSEILGLNVSDINQQTTPWAVNICRGSKGGETRWVPVSAELKRVLKEWLEVRAEWCREHGHTSDALLPVDRVRRLSHNGISECVRALRTAAGIPQRLTPHGLRHDFATHVDAAEGIRTTQELLGHAHRSTTENYIHPSNAAMIRAVNAIPAHLPQPEQDARARPRFRRWPRK